MLVLELNLTDAIDVKLYVWEKTSYAIVSMFNDLYPIFEFSLSSNGIFEIEFTDRIPHSINEELNNKSDAINHIKNSARQYLKSKLVLQS